MNLFYVRTETESEVVVTFKPHLFYFMLSGFFVWGAEWMLPQIQILEIISGILSVLIILAVIWRLVSMRKVMAEIRVGMKNGEVRFSGTRLSLNNPMTARIPKKFLHQ